MKNGFYNRKPCSYQIFLANQGKLLELRRVGNLDPVHTGPDPYGHHINLKSLKTSMTLKFVIILQNFIKAYHRKSGKSKYDRKLTELDVETTRIRSRVNGVLNYSNFDKKLP